MCRKTACQHLRLMERQMFAWRTDKSTDQPTDRWRTDRLMKAEFKFYFQNCPGVYNRKCNYGKEKKWTLCFASFCLTMDLNHRKSMTILKLCKKSSKCDVAGHCSFICLEMAMVWRKKSLIEKVLISTFFQWAILVFPFLSIMQLRIVIATRYPLAN